MKLSYLVLAVLVGVSAADRAAPIASDVQELTTVKTTHTSVGGEIKNALVEALIGIVLVCLAFPVLYFNEKRQVHMDTIFDWAEPRIEDIEADKVDPEREGTIVCVHGGSATEETLMDDPLGVKVLNCAKLRREVEMFQWVERTSSKESDTNTGGKETTTTYTYEQEWSSTPINSNDFQEKQHQNPPFPSLSSKTFTAQDVTLGAFKLDAALIGQMQNWSPAEIGEQDLDGRSFAVKQEGCIQSGSGTEVGDVRITVSKVECGACSVASLQRGSDAGEFVPLTFALVPRGCCGAPDKVDFKTEQLIRGDVEIGGPCSCIGALVQSGECIHNLYEERKDGKEVITLMRKNQQCLHKGLHVAGFLMFLIGDYLIFKLAGSIFRVVPFIGTWIEALFASLAFVAACLCACQCWLLTVALSWLATRPLKGFLLLTLVVGIFAGMSVYGNSLASPTTTFQPSNMTLMN